MRGTLLIGAWSNLRGGGKMCVASKQCGFFTATPLSREKGLDHICGSACKGLGRAQLLVRVKCAAGLPVKDPRVAGRGRSCSRQQLLAKVVLCC